MWFFINGQSCRYVQLWWVWMWKLKFKYSMVSNHSLSQSIWSIGLDKKLKLCPPKLSVTNHQESMEQCRNSILRTKKKNGKKSSNQLNFCSLYFSNQSWILPTFSQFLIIFFLKSCNFGLWGKINST